MKNAIIYSASLPAANHLAHDLSERPWREILPGEKSHRAFIENDEGVRVHTFPGGYAICLRTDEKIVPPAVVKAEAEKRVKKIEREEGYKVGKKQRIVIKEGVFNEFLEKALVKQQYTWAYYDQERGLLFVDGSKSHADALMTELVSACKSVKTQTIHIADIKHGLTTRLQTTIEESIPQFGELGIGQDLTLSRRSKGEPLERVTYKDCDITSNEVYEQLMRGFEVDQLEIASGQCLVRLTKDFHFKGFKWDEVEAYELDIDELDDELEQWKHETSTRVALASGIALELCKIMNYEPPEVDEEAA